MRINASGVLKEGLAELDVVVVGHRAVVALYGAGIAGDIISRALRFHHYEGSVGRMGYLSKQRESVARLFVKEVHSVSARGNVTLVTRLYVRDFHTVGDRVRACLLYTSPSPRDGLLSRMPSSA